MNVLFIASRFATATVVDLPLKAPRLLSSAIIQAPAPAFPVRRNRYSNRSFGVGYGRSEGYAKARSYFGTPSLSRYR